MGTTKLTSRGWYHAMGKATEQLHQDSFPQALMEVFHRAFTFDFSMIMIYLTDSAPKVVFEERVSGLVDKKGQMRYYLDGLYLLDPLYQVAIQQPDAGLYSLKDVTPDNFYRSEFYKRHFTYTNLKDDINYILPIAGIGTVVINIGCARRFNKAEMERFHTIEPWVLSVMKCQWGTSTRRQRASPEQVNLHQELIAGFQNFGRSQLTDRECDITHLILKGHSSKSAADKLNISAETVKAHRRNIYRKLGLQSQSELFSLFLKALATQSKGPVYADPLEAYLAQTEPL
jgi:DNA-binding CsgD family transcriptional regulator